MHLLIYLQNTLRKRAFSLQKVKTSGQRILSRGHIAGEIFLLGKFNMTLDCFCGRPFGTLVDSTACGGIPTSGPLGTVLCGVWENPDVTPSKVPLPLGKQTPSSLGPRDYASPHPKRRHDRFSRFCKAHGRYRQTDRQTTLLRL